MGGESRFPFTSVWMMGLAWKGELQDLCFQARECKWEKKRLSVLSVQTPLQITLGWQHQIQGTIFLSLWSSLHLCQDG